MLWLSAIEQSHSQLLWKGPIILHFSIWRGKNLHTCWSVGVASSSRCNKKKVVNHRRKHSNPHQSKESITGCHLSFNFVCTCFKSGCLHTGCMDFHDSPRRQMIPAYRFSFGRCVNKRRAKQLWPHVLSLSDTHTQTHAKLCSKQRHHCHVMSNQCPAAATSHRSTHDAALFFLSHIEDRCGVAAGES